MEHLPPAGHPAFYAAQRFTLDITRADMPAAGWSPSVRLFEAAACGVPAVADPWTGLGAFFEPGAEIVVADHGDDVRRALAVIEESQRVEIGRRARLRVLGEHTAAHRAAELEDHVTGALACA